MRKFRVSILIAALLLVLGVLPAAATTPLDVSIVGVYIYATGTGTFEASGPAVDAGLFCPAGTTIDPNTRATGWQSFHSGKFGVIYHGDKTMTCNDGSGSITIQLQARIDWKGDIASWVVKSGTGAYASLKGTGMILGVPLADIGVTDYYSGQFQ